MVTNEQKEMKTMKERRKGYLDIQVALNNINERISQDKAEFNDDLEPLMKIPAIIAKLETKINFIEDWIKEYKKSNQNRFNVALQFLSTVAAGYIIWLLRANIMAK